jgi:hypothetical protein
MRAGIVLLSQLHRTGRWDAGFNLDVAQMEQRLADIGKALDEDKPFEEIASLIKESDERSGGNVPKISSFIFSNEIPVEKKVEMAARRLFKGAMLRDYMPGGRLYDKWFTFFISYAASCVTKRVQDELAKISLVASVGDDMEKALKERRL